MIDFGESVQQGARRWTYLAFFMVILCVVVGVVQLRIQAGAPAIRDPSWAAGEAIDTEPGTPWIFWGQGAAIDVQSVTCTSIRVFDAHAGRLPPGPPPGSADLATVDDPDRGQLVYLADNSADGRSGDKVVCTGGGLERIWASKVERTSDKRIVAIGCLVAAPFFALLGLLMLRISRSGTRRT